MRHTNLGAVALSAALSVVWATPTTARAEELRGLTTPELANRFVKLSHERFDAYREARNRASELYNTSWDLHYADRGNSTERVRRANELLEKLPVAALPALRGVEGVRETPAGFQLDVELAKPPSGWVAGVTGRRAAILGQWQEALKRASTEYRAIEPQQRELTQQQRAVADELHRRMDRAFEQKYGQLRADIETMKRTSATREAGDDYHDAVKRVFSQAVELVQDLDRLSSKRELRREKTASSSGSVRGEGFHWGLAGYGKLDFSGSHSSSGYTLLPQAKSYEVSVANEIAAPDAVDKYGRATSFGDISPLGARALVERAILAEEAIRGLQRHAPEAGAGLSDWLDQSRLKLELHDKPVFESKYGYSGDGVWWSESKPLKFDLAQGAAAMLEPLSQRGLISDKMVEVLADRRLRSQLFDID